MATPAEKANLARIRDNQRRSRARRKEYIQELEHRIREFEKKGNHATEAMQKAARAVANENRKLRMLLNKHGIDDDKIEAYLVNKIVALPGDPASPGFRTGSAGGAVASLERLLSSNNGRRTTGDLGVAPHAPFSPLSHLGGLGGRDSREASVVSNISPIHAAMWDGSSVTSPGARSVVTPVTTLAGTMAAMSAASHHFFGAGAGGPRTPPISTISSNESTASLGGLMSSQSGVGGPGSPEDIMDHHHHHHGAATEFSAGVDDDGRHSSHSSHSSSHPSFGYDMSSRGYGSAYPPPPDTPSSMLDDHHHHHHHHQSQHQSGDVSGHGYLLTPPHHQHSFHHSDHQHSDPHHHHHDAHMAALTTDLLASMAGGDASGNSDGAGGGCTSFGCLSDVSGGCGDVDSVSGFGAVLAAGGPYSPASLHL